MAPDGCLNLENLWIRVEEDAAQMKGASCQKVWSYNFGSYLAVQHRVLHALPVSTPISLDGGGRFIFISFNEVCRVSNKSSPLALNEYSVISPLAFFCELDSFQERPIQFHGHTASPETLW